jgi:hypothetical protein
MWLLLVRRLWRRYDYFSFPTLHYSLVLSFPFPYRSKHRASLTLLKQGIVKGFTDSGFKTQVQPLSSFQESYGLEADEDEDEGHDDEDEDDETGTDAGTAEEHSGDEK